MGVLISLSHVRAPQLFGLTNRLRREESGRLLRTPDDLVWLGLTRFQRVGRGYAFGRVENKLQLF